MEIYCDITTALWSRNGSAVVTPSVKLYNHGICIQHWFAPFFLNVEIYCVKQLSGAAMVQHALRGTRVTIMTFLTEPLTVPTLGTNRLFYRSKYNYVQYCPNRVAFHLAFHHLLPSCWSRWAGAGVQRPDTSKTTGIGKT